MVDDRDTLDCLALPDLTPRSLLQHFGPGMILMMTGIGTSHLVTAPLTPLNVPRGPVLSLKELAEEPSLRATGTVVEVDHPTRGRYLSVGNPIKLSGSPVQVTRSPLLGEHTDAILRGVLGMDAQEIEAAKRGGAV